MRLATSLAEIGVRGTGLAVLPGVTEIGDDGGDALGRGAAQGVAHDEQLHHVVVGGKGCGLDDESVRPAHVFLNLDEDFHIGEAAHLAARERLAQIGCDGFGERAVRIARQNLETSHACPRIAKHFGAYCHKGAA